MTYRIFLSGQKHFGEAVYRMALERGLEVIGVSAPEGDRLYRAAAENGTPVSAAGTRLDADRIPGGADLIICAYSHEYVTPAARAASTYGAVGYHPSLLPDLRGKNAVSAAVDGRYTETGGSLYILDDGYDTGEVLAQERCAISDGETAASLWRGKLSPIGLRLFASFFDELNAYGPVWDAAYTRCYYAPDAW